MARNIFTVSLRELLPSSIVNDPNISALITALEPNFEAGAKAFLNPLIFSRIDELPENVLDLLAWQLHADLYDLAATPEMERSAVKNSIKWHMHKGTQSAIVEALEMLGIEAEFVHWHDSGEEPYTFRLKAKVTGDFYRTQGRDKLMQTIRRAVEASKSARSLFAGIDTRMEFREDIGLYVGTSGLLSGNRRLGLQPVSYPEKSIYYAGMSSSIQGEQRILLNREREVMSRVYAGNVSLMNVDVNIGVNLEEMQELLLRFEERILARIDSYETRLMNLLNANQEAMNKRLDDILELLRWKGDDEAI